MAQGTAKTRFATLWVIVLGAILQTNEARADEAPTFADRVDETTEDGTRSAAFFISPLAMSAGVFGAEADIALGRKLAVAFEGDVYGVGGAPVAAIGAGLLIYPFRSAFHGLYLEPRFVFARSLREAPLDVDWNSDVVGLGGVAGWQWSWDYGFSVRLGAGAMEYVGGPGSLAPSGALALGGADFVVDASIGWTF